MGIIKDTATRGMIVMIFLNCAIYLSYELDIVPYGGPQTQQNIEEYASDYNSSAIVDSWAGGEEQTFGDIDFGTISLFLKLRVLFTGLPDLIGSFGTPEYPIPPSIIIVLYGAWGFFASGFAYFMITGRDL